MERILFGDNQFFGINHLSEEKARQQTMRFQSIEPIAEVLKVALSSRVRGFMCTTHERVGKLAAHIRNTPEEWDGLRFYPCMPYAHKYANAVTELGYIEALRSFLPREGLVDALLRGSKVMLTRDLESIIGLLVDTEMRMFEGFETPVIFLQNVVTDLLQGLGVDDAFSIFASHVRRRYNAEPGFITMNLPKLLPVLRRAGLCEPIVCANVNKIAFRMSGGVHAYREATSQYPAQVIAMSVLASGGIDPRDAVHWVTGEPYVKSILFGASSRANIEQTVGLIRASDANRKRENSFANAEIDAVCE